MSPMVTVVVPTKDRSVLLDCTLTTIFGQKGVDLEIVVVDDGSVDPKATAVLERWMSRGGVRGVRHEHPVGACGARNAGVAVGRGEWIAFCDDDDLWAPDKLAAQLEAVVTTDIQWAYTGAVEIDAGNRVVGGEPAPTPESVLATVGRRNPVPAGASNVLVRRSVFDEVGGFDRSLAHVGDWDLWRRLCERGAPAAVHRPLVAYRQHGGNDNLQVVSIVDELRRWERTVGADVDWPAVYGYYGDVLARDGRVSQALRWRIREVIADHRALRRVVGGARRARRPVPPAWQEQAERWLRAVAAPGSPGQGDPQAWS